MCGAVKLERLVICYVISVFPSHSGHVKPIFTKGEGVVDSRVESRVHYSETPEYFLNNERARSLTSTGKPCDNW